jgi:hypothetical protein
MLGGLIQRFVEAHPTVVLGARIEQHNPVRRVRRSDPQSWDGAFAEQLRCDELERRACHSELTSLVNPLLHGGFGAAARVWRLVEPLR